MGQRTVLHAWHVANQARMVEFGDWEMPISYASITQEHAATRQAGGIFDISHMGRLRFTGTDTVRFLDHLLTNQVEPLRLGQIRYSLMLNESGGILDDVLVYRFADCHLLVVNASNREKILEWLQRHSSSWDVSMTDMTSRWAMIACQGPQAWDIAARVLDEFPPELRYYHAARTHYHSEEVVLSRTGYTGEDGVELMVPVECAVDLWQQLLDQGSDVGLQPVGLGARDTLRLEAAMPLYGHELSEEIDPIQAGLSWAVKADRKEFIGKEALAAKDPQRPVRVGMRLADKRIARQGFVIRRAGQAVGEVTSGTFAPTLQASIAMGYVVPEVAAPDTEVEIEIRGRPVPASVVPLPFYQRRKR